MSNISVSAPLQPHELDKKELIRLQQVVKKVSSKAVIQGRGEDLLMRVYLSGLYHGMMMSDETEEKK